MANHSIILLGLACDYGGLRSSMERQSQQVSRDNHGRLNQSMDQSYDKGGRCGSCHGDTRTIIPGVTMIGRHVPSDHERFHA